MALCQLMPSTQPLCLGLAAAGGDTGWLYLHRTESGVGGYFLSNLKLDETVSRGLESRNGWKEGWAGSLCWYGGGSSNVQEELGLPAAGGGGHS